MSVFFAPGLQSQIIILCPCCGAVGEAIWEAERGGPYLVSLSKGFFEQLARRQPYNLEIVCKACGTAQAQRQPPPAVSNDAGVWAQPGRHS